MREMKLKHWLPLIGLTLSAFIFNTSEFIPIGLLSDIARDFSTTEALAGMLISVYAWFVTILSMPLMIFVSKIELRKLMIIVTFVFVIFQLTSAISQSYAMLMISRIGVACSHAVFWSIVSPIAVRIVPEKARPLALMMIATGTSIAIILGLPLGRIIGLTIGWRMTFLCIGIFAASIAIYLGFCLPKVPSRGGFSFRQLPQLLRNKPLVRLYIFTLLVVTGYYTGYSYIEPFMGQVAHLSENMITTTLMVFGIMGIIGSFAYSRFYPKRPYLFMCVAILIITTCLSSLGLAASIPVLAMAICGFWGMAVNGFNVAMQQEVIDNSSTEATAVAMSIYSGIYNLGIGSGTFLGGAVCTYLSISHIGYIGGTIVFAGQLFWLIKVIRSRIIGI